MLEWISLTPTMAGSAGVGSVAQGKRIVPICTSIAPSGGPKNSPSFAHTLYRLGISEVEGGGTIPPAPHNDEVSSLVTNLPLNSTSIKKWVLNFEPNEATLVSYLCKCLFKSKVSTFSKNMVTILHEFPGPFKSHQPTELGKGDDFIKYPLVKHNKLTEKSEKLQTPAEVDLRARSDFVFAASRKYFDEDIIKHINIRGMEGRLPGFSSDCSSCAVAITAEVKAICSPASVAAAFNQWSVLAYTQMMDRISVIREATYVGDENICQYGYGICGLVIRVWKMSLKRNKGTRRGSEVLNRHYLTFPVQLVMSCNLEIQEDAERFITLHKELLKWWLGRYIPSYVKDLSKNVVAHYDDSKKWTSTWQEELKKCRCLVNHLPVFLLTLKA